MGGGKVGFARVTPFLVSVLSLLWDASGGRFLRRGPHREGDIAFSAHRSS